MTISEEGKKALVKWAKIRDYVIPSVTLAFDEEGMSRALEIAFAEKIPHAFGMIERSIEVPAAFVGVFAHLSPKVISHDEKEAIRKGRGKRKLVTPEEAKAEMARQIREWNKRHKGDGERDK